MGLQHPLSAWGLALHYSILCTFQQALIFLSLKISCYEQPQSERESASNISREKET